MGNGRIILLTKILMIFGGFWNKSISNSRLLNGIYRSYAVFMKTTWIVLYFMLIFELIRLIFNDYERSVIITSMGVAVNGTKISLKLMIFKKHNLLAVIDDIVEGEKNIWRSKNEEIKKLYRGRIKVCDSFILILFITTVQTTIAMLIAGAFEIVQIKKYNHLHNTTIEDHAMYQTLYPRNKQEHLCIQFSSQTLFAWCAIIYNTFTHSVLVAYLTYADSQLRILQYKFRNFIEPEFSLTPTEEEIQSKIAVLKDIVEEHTKVIRFVKNLNNGVKNIILMEFFLASMDMASCSFNLLRVRDGLGWIFLILFFILLQAQLLLMTWNCNEIYVQSGLIASALFESKWYVLNNDAKKLVYIIMARAQRPLCMTIGIFGPMTTASALAVMKAAYSFVSIMKE